MDRAMQGMERILILLTILALSTVIEYETGSRRPEGTILWMPNLQSDKDAA